MINMSKTILSLLRHARVAAPKEVHLEAAEDSNDVDVTCCVRLRVLQMRTAVKGKAHSR